MAWVDTGGDGVDQWIKPVPPPKNNTVAPTNPNLRRTGSVDFDGTWGMPGASAEAGLGASTGTAGEGVPFAPAVTTPAPVPAAPAQGRWVTPDYASMIPGAWEITNAGAEGNRLTGQAESDFQKMFRQAFIDWGGDAAKAGDYSKYLDAPTIQAAQQNKFSRVAQNLRAMQKAQRRARALLAARGLTSSGANTGQMREIMEQREKADYGDLRGLLGVGDQGYASLASARERVAELMRQARRDAAARLAAENPSYWNPGS